LFRNCKNYFQNIKTAGQRNASYSGSKFVQDFSVILLIISTPKESINKPTPN
jgi:hypothetical protein